MGLRAVPERPSRSGGRRLFRWRRARRLVQLVNKGISALNWLDGWTADQAQHGNFDDMAEETARFLEGLSMVQQPGGEIAGPPELQAAYHELLRGRTGYGDSGGAGSLVAYQRGAVSLPDEIKGAPLVEEICGDRGRHFLVGEGVRMLKPASDIDSSELAAIPTYCDPTLLGSRKRYKTFIRDLHRRGLVVFVIYTKCQVGIFFVSKKMENNDSFWMHANQTTCSANHLILTW